MNHIEKTQSFAILGAVMALALMPIMVDSVYADTTDKVSDKIQEIEKRLNIIQEKSENFKDSEIGKQVFQFRITGELLSEFKEPSYQALIKSNSYLKGKVSNLFSTYSSSLTEYNKKVTGFEKESNISLDKKNLISQLKKNQIDYKTFEAKVEKTQQMKELVKSEIVRKQAERDFQKIHRDIYVEHNLDRGYNPDDTILIALDDVIDKENFALVSVGIDKIINQYHDADIRSQLQEYKAEVLDAIKELEGVNNQNTQVMALTSGDIDMPITGNGLGEENEIFNSEIITSQLKEKIKNVATNIKKLADNISTDYKSSYQAALKVANDNSDTSIVVTTTPDPEPEPEDDGKKDKKGKGHDKHGDKGKGKGHEKHHD